ncbi:protein of unknown function [Halanaerobium congolense]|uniref:DUF3870 domain-containing protein n=1 Tax=Halanaerobium congolense TaxID=54121 RepID=A0A1G8IVJ1_9FIRM|nr:DUF3870 domain-containing protein [Halanaerobium congolense]SDI22876.1 protein of unknown function [Halanaerobium congolense]SES66228.1 protein of unknown function [Halanaerobium congolense]
MEKVFVTGYAKFPSDITGNKVYEEIAVGLIVNKESGMIIDADFSLVTRTGKKFMTDFLIDRNLYEIKKITDELRKYYFGQAQNAVVAALKSAKRQFVSKTK